MRTLFVLALMTSTALAQTMPKPADTIPQSFGIVDHMAFHDNVNTPPGFVYGDPQYDAIIQPWLAKSGVRFIRGPSCTGFNSMILHRIQESLALGIKFSIVLEQGFNASTLDACYNNFAGQINDYEGSNEPDLGERCAAITANQTIAWNAVQADALIKHVPLWGPSLTLTNPVNWLANCAPLNKVAAAGNWHTYIHAANPEAGIWMTSYLDHCNKVFGGETCNITEFGYRTCQPGETSPSLNRIACVSQPISARYFTRWVLYNKKLGYGQMYAHQIADNHGPALNPTTGQYDEQSGYGVAFDWLGVPKPAGATLSTLLARFKDPTTFSPTPLAYAITHVSGNAGVRIDDLYQKSTGEYMLVVWLGQPGWGVDSINNYIPVTVAPEVVNIQLGTSATSISIDTYEDDGSVVTVRHAGVAGLFRDVKVTDKIRVIRFK
jgi:hypothetical protein